MKKLLILLLLISFSQVMAQPELPPDPEPLEIHPPPSDPDPVCTDDIENSEILILNWFRRYWKRYFKLWNG